ncbi:MAG: 5-amino-6-(D-ribitylamino)uracil--L-tyrosine 4-hydroxyphenyl transferase CofH [Pseudomonadales bacterium]|nr:5-amino-6-(D-ribitylamino)uracil--L-tyrosine 4-hydroxyphenyl transferase CofH [Pseudomonadales bacterium]MBP6480912.1 5-amino-6-(D-ribitylamino)uracil--L-tyrosine 4-hydroxyphenyl transferase CofH [Pseudomonadales bacterium]
MQMLSRNPLDALAEAARCADGLSDEQALALAGIQDTAALMHVAAGLRDAAHGNVISYSRKVFIPLTHLCRDVCHYCTFAQTPKRLDSPYMSLEQVLASAREGARLGCKEALFTLGEKPELRYRAAREALQTLGFATTLEYLAHVARAVLEETGLFPHINAGNMDAREIALLRPLAPSMGIMLESASERLCAKGMPHHGSPDKAPAARLQTMRLAGEARVPFTSGILIGIGETREERIESLLALRAIHRQYGNLQEVIVQNFRAKPGTRMAGAPEPDLEELLWSIAVARLILGPAMNIQAPPNLSPGVLARLVEAGINDWGGVSPVTPDFVNPEAPWPHLGQLAAETAGAGKFLQERLTIYPSYVREASRWVDESLHARLLAATDAEGFPRVDGWLTGSSTDLPALERELLAGKGQGGGVSARIEALLARAGIGEDLDEAGVTALLGARGADFARVCAQADALNRRLHGERVSYVVNRNINYTNVCYFKCQFCAFSKGKAHDHLRGTPYDLDDAELTRRVAEAWARGATEVCLQGGIHPAYTGQKYLDICRLVKEAAPGMHIHAFSPLEVWQGARTLGVPLGDFIAQLREAGLGTLPGTAAEILHDEVRAVLCPDKIDSAQWLEVMEAAHSQGVRTTATMMYGHIEQPRHQAHHLLAIRDLQRKYHGFTEFVPLPFVAGEAPMYLRGRARRGPTFREAVLLHAVARIVLYPDVPSIQASWVKMGAEGVAACLHAGANDVGGTLMNESITRAAGAAHGEEFPPAELEQLIRDAGREPWQRTTLYEAAPPERHETALHAAPLTEYVNTPVRRAAPGARKGGVIAHAAR